MQRSIRALSIPLFLALIASSGARATEALEELEIAQLGAIGPHSVWVTDLLFRHSLLFDADSGEALATLDAGFATIIKPPLYSRILDEFYVVEAAYEWGHRGKRKDFITIYDEESLLVKGEIVIPMQAADSASNIAYTEFLDGERILAIFNQFPATSVSLIDLETRSYLNTIQSAGCAGIYPTGPLSFAMLCGNGRLRNIHIDEEGKLVDETTSEVFFDPVEDPVTMRGCRTGKRWIFVSFKGWAYEVDFEQNPPATRSWSMLDASERKSDWRPGGRQLMALHRGLGRLYVLFHRGGSGTHKDPGRQIWVFDVETGRRIDTFELPNMAAASVAGLLGLESGFVDWVLEHAVPPLGGDTITTTQDDAPLLLVRNSGLAVVAVLDAISGEHLRDLEQVGLTGNRLVVP
jgi:methylamine dehydrogenase heavy chain